MVRKVLVSHTDRLCYPCHLELAPWTYSMKCQLAYTLVVWVSDPGMEMVR